MSDDLVKRLRNTPNWKREEYGDYKSAMVHYDRAPFEAADRIEELELAVRYVADLAQMALDARKELEAKLAKRKELILTLVGDKLDLSSEIAGLKVKLAKVVEAERQACANVVKHFYENGQVTKPDDIINRTILTELKGGIGDD